MLTLVCPGPEDGHASPGHPERPDRIRAALRDLRHRPVAPSPATVDDALLVHTKEMVERVRTARGPIDGDTYVTPATWDAALRAAGSAIHAATHAPGFSLARPPGHHATPDRAMGFCLLNNVALAAEREARAGRRVAIVDVDVHHGNGTQDAFYAREDVLFCSLHEWPLYPGTGAATETGRGAGLGKTVNVPLPAGTGHDAWLAAFDAKVMPAVRAHRADIILVTAGFDAHWRDPLAHLRLTSATFHEAVRRLREVQPRIAAVLEGGYDLEALSACVPAVASALVGEPFTQTEASPPP